jgi:hypothetical protein
MVATHAPAPQSISPAGQLGALNGEVSSDSVEQAAMAMKNAKVDG